MQISLVKGNRKTWIDALRGLAMFLVIFGHSLDVDPQPRYFLFTAPFMMPLFFAISAYLLNDTKPLKLFLLNLLRGIIVPWFILGMFRVVILTPFRGWGYLLDGFLRLLTGADLWFMPCYTIAVLFHFLARKYIKKDIWIILISFAAFFLGLFLYKNGILTGIMFNQALTAQPFFVIGFLFRKHSPFFERLAWPYIALAGALYFALFVLAGKIFPTTVIDIHLLKYYNIPYCLMLSFLSVWTLFAAASKANFCSKIMSFVGQNTLVTYIWSGGAISILMTALSAIGWNLPANGWVALGKTVYACIVCGFCSIFLERFVPWAVGKKKKSQNAVA